MLSLKAGRVTYKEIFERTPLRVGPIMLPHRNRVWLSCETAIERISKFVATPPELPKETRVRLNLPSIEPNTFYLFQLGGTPHVLRRTSDGLVEVYEVAQP